MARNVYRGFPITLRELMAEDVIREDLRKSRKTCRAQRLRNR